MDWRWAWVVAVVWAAPALGQEPPDPDAEWHVPASLAPGVLDAPLSPPPPPPPALPPLPWGSRPARRGLATAEQVFAPPAPEEPNRISLFGAPSLGRWQRGFAASMGFPLLGLRAGLGLSRSLDLGLSFESVYGVANEARGWLRSQFWGTQTSRWSASAQLEGGRAFFAQSGCAEGQGGRWYTGRRDYNAQAGAQLSYRGLADRAPRVFMGAHYLITFDTEPCMQEPLGGVPPALIVGHNLLLKLGAEVPLSERTSFVLALGLDLHGRDTDSVVMPNGAVGIATSF